VWNYNGPIRALVRAVDAGAEALSFSLPIERGWYESSWSSGEDNRGKCDGLVLPLMASEETQV